MNEKQLKGMLSSATDLWPTPQEFFDKLNAEFNFNLDPCCTAENAKCDFFYDKESNGLKRSWKGFRVFMNPPYGREIKEWMRKAERESRHSLVVCLVPARTDTFWWHEYAMKADDIRYVRGRLKFGNAKNSAPFPSAVVVFKNKSLIDTPKA